MKQADGEGMRVVSSYLQVIEGTPDVVFPLLCPVREAEWVDGWQGWPIYAQSGVAEPDGVFASRHGDDPQETIWLVSRLDAGAGDIELVAFVPGRQVFRLSIAVRPLGERQSEVAVRYVRTGISPEGNSSLHDLQQRDGDTDMMREWELDMNHFLVTGTRRAPAKSAAQGL